MPGRGPNERNAQLDKLVVEMLSQPEEMTVVVQCLLCKAKVEMPEADEPDFRMCQGCHDFNDQQPAPRYIGTMG